MAIDALENQTSNLEWTIPDIVVRAILARKKLSGSSGLKWNFVVITNVVMSLKKTKRKN